MSLGLPELLVVLFFGFLWLIPVAAGIWALITLHRLRRGQDDIRRRLDAIEATARRPSA